MKKIHPKYQKVLFIDSSTEHKYLIGTTLQVKEKEMYEGVEYPSIRVSISSSSHPYFIGGKQFVDTEGRVEKFTKRYQVAQQKAQYQKEGKEKEEQEQKEELAKAKKKKK